jgi:hypothetical protein
MLYDWIAVAGLIGGDCPKIHESHVYRGARLMGCLDLRRVEKALCTSIIVTITFAAYAAVKPIPLASTNR